MQVADFYEILQDDAVQYCNWTKVTYEIFEKVPEEANEAVLKSNATVYLKAGLYDEIFLSRPSNFYFERKVLKYFRKRNVCMKYYSVCSHNQVLFIQS